MGSGARSLLSRPVGRTVHRDPCVRRPRRNAPPRRPARGPAREGLRRRYEPGVVPATAGGSARSVSALRESRLGGQVIRPDERDDAAEPPSLPGFRTWRAVYLFVLGWFALVVALLTVFTRLFS